MHMNIHKKGTIQFPALSNVGVFFLFEYVMTSMYNIFFKALKAFRQGKKKNQ